MRLTEEERESARASVDRIAVDVEGLAVTLNGLAATLRGLREQALRVVAATAELEPSGESQQSQTLPRTRPFPTGWTVADDRILMDTYPRLGTRATIEALAAIGSVRSEYAVTSRAQKLRVAGLIGKARGGAKIPAEKTKPVVNAPAARVGRPRVEPADRFCLTCGELIPKVTEHGRRRGPSEHDRLDYCSRGHAVAAGWAKKREEEAASVPAAPAAVETVESAPSPPEPVKVDPVARRERLVAAKAARARPNGEVSMSQVLEVLATAKRPLSSVEVTVALVGRETPAPRQEQAHRRIAPLLSTLVAAGKATRIRAHAYGEATRYAARVEAAT